MRAVFDVLEPAAAETPVIVEIPHSGLDVPAPMLEPLAAPARALARDADLHVDALYEDAPAEGATTLCARASRYVIDVNRAESDLDAEVFEGVRGGPALYHGLVWRTTSEGTPALVRKLTQAELDERLTLVWRPYHAALRQLIDRKLARFGACVVLAAHSMPSVERAAGAGKAPRARADVVPGTRGRRSAAPVLIDEVERLAREAGWTVRHDDPYSGGYTTQHYGRPAEGVHVVQVELARRLYLDEATLRLKPSFGAARAWCRSLVKTLGSACLPG